MKNILEQEKLQTLLKKECFKPTYLDQSFPKYFPNTNLPKISAIVPTFNRCPNPVSENSNPLGWCLESLAVQKGDVLGEVIIVNDASGDNTEEVVRSFQDKLGVPLVYERNEINKGSSKSRNLAVGMAKYDLVMFLDDDCVFSKWMFFGANFTLEKLEDSVAAVHLPVYHRKTVPVPVDKNQIGVLNLEEGIITGNYEGFPVDYLKNPEAHFIDEDLKIIKPIKITNLGGIFLAKKNIFEEIGGFPEFFTWRNGFREETDVALRFGRSGHSIYFTPDPKFYCVHLKYGATGEHDFKELDPTLQSFVEQSNITRSNTGNRVGLEEWFHSFITSTYATLGRESSEAAQKFKYGIYKNFVVGNTMKAAGIGTKINDYETREAIFNQAIEDGNKLVCQTR